MTQVRQRVSLKLFIQCNATVMLVRPDYLQDFFSHLGSGGRKIKL